MICFLVFASTVPLTGACRSSAFREPLPVLEIAAVITQVHTTAKLSQSVWGRYHGGRRPSSDDSLHSPTVIPLSALDKPSIMKRYHRRRTCSHTSPRRSPAMVALHDTRFVECRWWNDGWTVKPVVTCRSPPLWPSGKASASRAEDPGFESRLRRDFFGVESYQ